MSDKKKYTFYEPISNTDSIELQEQSVEGYSKYIRAVLKENWILIVVGLSGGFITFLVANMVASYIRIILSGLTTMNPYLLYYGVFYGLFLVTSAIIIYIVLSNYYKSEIHHRPRRVFTISYLAIYIFTVIGYLLGFIL